MNILLISPPVSIPTVMPYSLAMLAADLKSKLQDKIVTLDLNALWHYNEFQDLYQRKNSDFFNTLTHFINETRHIYPQISKAVLKNQKPIGYNRIIGAILEHNPDVVGISLTYNSQIFFTKQIITDLKNHKIPVVLGGPADYSKIMTGTLALPNSEKLIEHLINRGAISESSPHLLDFSIFNKEYYFTKETIYPLRTSISCPYKRCTFCTHHGNMDYKLLELEKIKHTIIANKMKKVYFIDDDFPLPRLKALASILKPLNIQWWCQLRPLKAIIDVLPMLKEAGLNSIAWGLESGSQRVLNLMQKGTKTDDIAEVLNYSKSIGIKNSVYVMFGLPGETKAEFMDTIYFLEKNQANIDVISPSVFGLQFGSRIMNDPDKFGIIDVSQEKRTYLGDKISYSPNKGLTQTEVRNLKKRNQLRLNNINKIPKVIAVCKEQILNI